MPALLRAAAAGLHGKCSRQAPGLVPLAGLAGMIKLSCLSPSQQAERTAPKHTRASTQAAARSKAPTGLSVLVVHLLAWLGELYVDGTPHELLALHGRLGKVAAVAVKVGDQHEALVLAARV